MKLSHLAKASLLLSFSASSLLHTSAIANENNQSQRLDEVVAAGQQINQSAVNSQLKVNGLTEQVQTKLQQFNTVTKELDGLNVYNLQMQLQLDNQVAELTQLAKSMEEVSVIERQISPLMARMISTLESFVQLDVPFLPEERSKRLNDLNDMMVRADTSVAEKFRRVLEAYQIEVDYGRTIESYSGQLTVDNQQMDVDFLRVGRVSYIYQTRDGSRLGQWDQASGQWQTLSQDYRLGVNKALRIARKQLAPDLIMVPLTNTQAKL
ncbi:DUF3450 domain-containing protein [Colwellia sp. 4_MG-2023]|jgi:hypothetical protein|uniref:DUF3450 domain-containing protein n=1 Tax=unclassified Colwellia TaxID=196834 RepID=UPI0026E2F0C6|nr:MULTISPECIES: DUF3450 domain-containing protein [unclassified Colwellia]MDO6487480.1 DUF3450 domain-containing protein [Colwellia sp. 6_MG-2023]MDO6508582.1 DUF3450 domain-containing protein [Colwellia sp. 5_MG-2023]MDO6557265.1 DUF3450 domain-containing protein [Colwellia sp. 4_MG-2023]